MSTVPLLELDDLHVAVDDHEILRGISLTVPESEVHVLMGPNGSGKSTLANALLANPAYEITERHHPVQGRGHHQAPHRRAGRPGHLPRLPAPRGDPRGERAQLPAPGPGRPQGHPGPLGARSAPVAHGLDQAPRHGRPLPGALPQRGVLRRRAQAQRDPPDGADGSRPRGARRDRQRPRHRRAAHGRARHQRGPRRRARTSGSCSSRTTSASSTTSRPTSSRCCSTARSSRRATPSSPRRIEAEGFDAFRQEVAA